MNRPCTSGEAYTLLAPIVGVDREQIERYVVLAILRDIDCPQGHEHEEEKKLHLTLCSDVKDREAILAIVSKAGMQIVMGQMFKIGE
jgi:hypothetical protein